MRPIAAAVALLFALAAHAQEAAPELVVTFRARPDVTPETLKELAEILEEKKVRIEETTTLREFLRAEYGTSIEPIRELFGDVNDSDAQILTEGTMVTLPAAPVLRGPTEAALPEDTKVAEFAKATTGYSGKLTLQDIAKRTKVSVQKLKAQVGGKVVLPYVSPYVSRPVRASFATRRDEIEARLQELMRKDDALHAEVSEKFRLTPHFGELTGSPGSCSFEKFAAVPHCGVDALASYQVTRPTIVAILDSGIAPNDKRFTLWRNAREATGSYMVDDDDNLYIDDFYGWNFVSGGGFPKDDVTVAHARYHGTHVAGIAACRLAAENVRKNINDRLHLMVLKVAGADATLAPGAVAEAVTYASLHGADIMNMSFEGPPSPIVREKMRETHGKILFVASAGNGANRIGRNLDTTQPAVYPADFSRTLPNVISVAAHDAKFNPACFSNFGETRIDIAAPGTDIESTVVGTTGRASGTSQATPFVTFAAALLHARGMNKPEQLKRRLMDSADFHPSLVGFVRSDGALNVAKALAYDRDIIRLRDGTLLIGTLAARPAIAVPKLGKSVPLANVRKIVAGYPTGNDATAKVVLDGAGLPAFAVDTIALPQLTINVNGATRVVAAKDIREVIPRTTLTP